MSGWDYQSFQKLPELSSTLSRHFNSWKSNRNDKILHPLYLVFSGARTGKSRLLDEFPRLCMEAAKPHPDLQQHLQSNFVVFKCSFEHNTSYLPRSQRENPTLAIGTRMLYQLRQKRSMTWPSFLDQLEREVPTDVVLERLAKDLNIESYQLSVLILIDGMHQLEHKNGDKATPFYSCVRHICDLLNSTADNPFVIVCCAATISAPVDTLLADLSQKCVFLLGE